MYGSGSDSYFQSYRRLPIGNASAAGMWMKTSHRESFRPASSTRTRFDEAVESRLASAQPADPPPTITKSYWEAVMRLAYHTTAFGDGSASSRPSRTAS